jgi:hypothetical protein
MVFEYLTVSQKKTFTDGQMFQNPANSSKGFFGMTNGQMGRQLGFTSYYLLSRPFIVTYLE